ncbi:hypothetical protein CHLNCDRAFT_143252 [Chlorella variabilis]|uniref:Uncharacterized protein n=1 Tax=Chlorella variabilis TaxID=554065 RepID=E1Z9T8_CHLVA|nr:hypothetical protein CHLNCDRAFT_143252 [Chlorella variabilis]EFN57580.1 hypothetical protein CHLNCDRAFT_143252 [Chlorella variabilis]|eukprot:XP_005849682.1 hypothetical protein CHLNCDRAFT_143252 [Chlorella variabilis]
MPTLPKAGSEGDAQLLREWLGEAPQYDPSQPDVLPYLRRLLQWGSPPGAQLAGAIVAGGSDGEPASVDLAVVHAAGCYPHTWAVPLTAAGVQAVNRCMAQAPAADPLSQLRLAVSRGMRRVPKRPRASSKEAGEEEEEEGERQRRQQPGPKQAGKRKQAQPQHLLQRMQAALGPAPPQQPQQQQQQQRWQRQQQQQRQQQRQQQHGGSSGLAPQLLPLAMLKTDFPSHRLVCVLSCFRKLIPSCRDVGPRTAEMTSMEDRCKALAQLLGPGAPQYSTDTHLWAYVEQLLQWGSPPGARLAGCVVRHPRQHYASVDLAVVHAAGCYPDAWQVPLTAAGVQAANRVAAAAGSTQRPAGTPAAPPAAGAAPAPSAARQAGQRGWAQDRQGWWRRRLSATAVGGRQNPIALDADTFRALTGRLPATPSDSLEVAAERGGASYRMSYHQVSGAASRQLRGAQVGAWVKDSGAQEGDIMALKRDGKRVLVKRIPGASSGTAAAAAMATAASPRAAAAGAKAGRGAASSRGGGGGGGGAGPSHAPQKHQHGGELLPMPTPTRRCPSEDLRCVLACLKRIIPSTRGAAQHAHTSSSGDAQTLRRLLGEAPAFDPTQRSPFEFLQHLLRWGAPPRAHLAGCFISSASACGDDGQADAVNLSALHAAGCYPHTWAVPLTKKGVQGANGRAAEEIAADPGAMVLEALAQGLQHARGSALTQARDRALLQGRSDAKCESPARGGGGAAKRAKTDARGAGPGKQQQREQQQVQQAGSRKRKQAADEAAADEEGEAGRPAGKRHRRRRQQQQQQQQQQQAAAPHVGGGDAGQPSSSGGAGSKAGAAPASKPFAGPSGAAPVPGARPLDDIMAQAAERKVQQALAAFAAADMQSGDSMLRPLQLLVLAGNGGQTLRDVVHSWRSYGLAQQQDVFDAVLLRAGKREWDLLEAQLRLALETVT